VLAFGKYRFTILTCQIAHQSSTVGGKGFMFAGSLLLLGFGLTMVMKPDWFGIVDSSLPARISFWWEYGGWFCSGYIYFTNNVFHKKPEKIIFSKVLRS
jgi:UMF1 family MFS transporter